MGEDNFEEFAADEQDPLDLDEEDEEDDSEMSFLDNEDEESEDLPVGRESDDEGQLEDDQDEDSYLFGNFWRNLGHRIAGRKRVKVCGPRYRRCYRSRFGPIRCAWRTRCKCVW